MPLPDFAQGIQTSFLDTATRARMQAHAAATTASDAPSKTADAGATANNDNDLTFHDLVNIVNPLQHLPVVSTLYRHYAHDPIKPLPKLAGDALYGGWMGLASSAADLAFEKMTGKSFGDTVLAFVTGDDTATDATTKVASTAAPAAAASAAGAASAGASAKTASAAPIPLVPTRVAAQAPAASPAPAVASAGASTAPVTTAAPPAATPITAAAQMPNIDAAAMDAFMTAVNSKGMDSDLSARTIDAYRRTVGMQAQTAPASATVH